MYLDNDGTAATVTNDVPAFTNAFPYPILEGDQEDNQIPNIVNPDTQVFTIKFYSESETIDPPDGVTSDPLPDCSSPETPLIL